MAAPDYPFNFHPFFMTIGFVVMMGEAIALWEPIKNLDRKTQKIVHASLTFIGLCTYSLH